MAGQKDSFAKGSEGCDHRKITLIEKEKTAHLNKLEQSSAEVLYSSDIGIIGTNCWSM